VLDSSPSAIMAFRSVRDRMGRIVDFEWILANRESDRMLGIDEGEAIGKRFSDEFLVPGSAELFKAFTNVVETGDPLDVERRSIRHQDTWLHLHALRLLDGLVVTVTDISETRNARDLLAEGDRLAVTGGIARTIAHEVRNPLTNLHMALEQLLEEVGPEKSDLIGPYADILRRNMQRISKLITDLLESSKAKELHKRPCAVHDLLKEALASVQDRLDLLEMKAELEVPPGLAKVMVDPDMLLVALTNLCINAIEAMQPNVGVLRLGATTERGKVRVFAEDNGKGIAKENIQRLFQAFYSGRSGGMGLGLTSARTILNAHGVHMNVESELGKGTRFVLTFPE
jgi:signal transduction histidine kinase